MIINTSKTTIKQIIIPIRVNKTPNQITQNQAKYNKVKFGRGGAGGDALYEVKSKYFKFSTN